MHLGYFQVLVELGKVSPQTVAFVLEWDASKRFTLFAYSPVEFDGVVRELNRLGTTQAGVVRLLTEADALRGLR